MLATSHKCMNVIVIFNLVCDIMMMLHTIYRLKNWRLKSLQIYNALATQYNYIYRHVYCM